MLSGYGADREIAYGPLSDRAMRRLNSQHRSSAQPNVYAVYISWRPGSPGFFTAFDAILPDGAREVVAFTMDQAVLLDRLDEELRLADRPTPELFSRLAAAACPRVAALKGTGLAVSIDRLIAAEAWTDAAIAHIELEIPSWKIRRLVREGDEWRCALSRQPNLPMELDDTVEASHELLPLAILRAFVEARRSTAVAPRSIATVPVVQPSSEPLICCENFS